MTKMTRHATVRAQQRGIRLSAIEATLEFGQEFRQFGPFSGFHLGKRAVKEASKKGFDVAEHENTVVIQATDSGKILTTYRTRDPRKVLRCFNQRPLDKDGIWLAEVTRLYSSERARRREFDKPTRASHIDKSLVLVTPFQLAA